MAETYFSHEKTTREIIDTSLGFENTIQVTSNLAIAKAILTLAAAVHEQTETVRNSSATRNLAILDASHVIASRR